MSERLRISQVARRVGISAKTIRYYESLGLIPALDRTETWNNATGYRLFREDDIRRLEFIRQARQLNLSLKEVHHLLEEARGGNRREAREHLGRLLLSKSEELDKQIEDLVARRRHLGALSKRLLANRARQAEAAACGCGHTPCG